LFCGLGGIGQRHLRNLRTIVGDELIVDAFRVRRNREKLLENLTIEPDRDLETDYRIIVHSDLNKALSIRPAAVFVCNPSSLHVPVALAAAGAGCNIFIEKPVSDSLSNVDELISLVDLQALVCCVGFNFRFHPALIQLKQLIDNRRFGNILAVMAEIGEYLPNWHKYEDYRGMYAARRDLGGGVILSQIHEFDLIYWLFGLPEVIWCRGGKLSDLDLDVEDTASSLMQYGGGTQERFAVFLHQDFVQRPPVRKLRVVGDSGKAEVDLLHNSLTVYGEQGEKSMDTVFHGFARNDMFMRQMEHFVACIRGEALPRVDLRAGVQSLRMALAAKRSMAAGSPVKLEDLPDPGTR